METTPALRTVPGAAVAALHRLAPDVDNTIFALSDFGFKIFDFKF